MNRVERAGFEPAVAQCEPGAKRRCFEPLSQRSSFCGAPGESRTPKILLLRQACLPVPSPGLCSLSTSAVSMREVRSRLATHRRVRCTWGCDPRAHPAQPRLRLALERCCIGTPEVERKTGLEPVASAVAWPRSANTELHPQIFARPWRRPVPTPASRQIVKEPLASNGSRRSAITARRVKKQKGPVPCQNRASGYRVTESALTSSTPSTR